MGGFNLRDLMSQAQELQEKMQQKMKETIVEASAGGGTVTVRMNGHKQLISIKIDPEAVTANDIEMLQDLIVAAVNEGTRKIEESMRTSLGGMIPGGLSGALGGM
jgi:DNA-binding YbaB/EbfC family protein